MFVSSPENQFRSEDYKSNGNIFISKKSENHPNYELSRVKGYWRWVD